MGIIQCVTVQEAIDLLHYCLEDGEVVPGKHFRDELEKENLVMEDALVVLRSGMIYKPPEHDVKTGEWKHTVEGYETGGKWLSIVFSFKTVERAYLITVFSVESRRKES